MNKLGQDNRPFLFVISFDLNANYLIPLDELDSTQIRFDLAGTVSPEKTELILKPEKIDFKPYKEAFDIVKQNLLSGNSFLTNLTASTPLQGDLDLLHVFQQSHAKYKLWIKDQLVCFSPETFVNISKEGKINTFPMKGTIDANTENAEQILKSDQKELYEHTTIVDLLRNDISKIADQVQVDRFRYLEKIKKSDNSEILQMSSEISGQLAANWQEKMGTLFFELLPAGSICGAPKAKTLEIINQAEEHLHQNGRGFYTGVFGIFENQKITSAVMIRFIEKTSQGFVFKSGGGITHLSEAEKEYDEIYQKLYVPIA